MSRRPSVASLSSIGSGLLKPISLPTLSESRFKPPQTNGSVVAPSCSASYGANLEVITERNLDAWDPDELFAKHTVSEVKAIQQRLRGDAEAKQEELRLMVGERYRDLLQASTSIISIASSSSHVLSAIHEVRRATASIRPFESAHVSAGGQGDEHLQTLQSLAAHLKLLLDAPEHLWRFMERKLYLHAAWLFLLSRVVHRSLLRGEEDDDVTWHALGIDISEQFPIVQRQWDAVSQFRSQISHKATMALRETNLSPSEVCAILLTLHLLESRPLPETLATFLAQRTRSLNANLTRSSELAPNGSASVASADEEGGVAKSRKVIIRETRRKLKTVLDIVMRTVGISRRIFIQSANSSGLMREVLRHVQGEIGVSTESLPSEVALTSQTLLTSLPSSNHFLLLPVAIRSYKPYIDAGPLLASEQDGQIKNKLGDWFKKAVQSIESAMGSWFAGLNTIRDVWELRRWCKTWLRSADELDAQEIEEFEAVLDSVCRQLAVKIWKSALNVTDAVFRQHVSTAVENIRKNHGIASMDIAPVNYLFNAPSVPSVAHGTTIIASSDTSFHVYRDSLTRQIIARTPQVDDVLSTVEKHVMSVREDFNATQQESEVTRQVPLPYASANAHVNFSLCSSRAFTAQLADDYNLHAVIFVGRIADHLSSAASFVENLACTNDATAAFHTQLTALYDRTLERWHAQTVTDVIRTHWPEPTPSQHEDNYTDDISPPARPSAQLVDSLLALSSAAQTLGVHTKTERLSTVVQEILSRFVPAIVRRLGNGEGLVPTTQGHWDLAFLLLLVEAWGSDMGETRTLLLAHIPWSTDAEWPPNVRDSLAECLSRSQVLLGLLLPPPALPTASTAEQSKSSGLLYLGLPTVDTQYHSAFELVKPSARFGLLLVGSSISR
ncbi:hypothetical protein BC629DRAFT_1283940 [Irpex lacteus]|nr:hypothetical protein BC629DRAFT_1283940 [Irpex lacteus]